MEISKLYVRRSALIRASVERVWDEFSTFARIAAWLDRGHKLHEFEPRPGGKVRLSVDIDGTQRFFGGTIVDFQPRAEVSFKDDWEDKDFAPFASGSSYWTFRLSPIDGETLVELFHHGYESDGDRAAQSVEDYENAWDNKHLKKLREIVESDS